MRKISGSYGEYKTSGPGGGKVSEVKPRFKRILLKLSGEVLAGGKGFGIDPETVSRYAQEIADVARMGTQVGIVIGGGNIWRGKMGPHMNRSRADSMGMMATIMNCLAMQDALQHLGLRAVTQTSVNIPQFAEFFVRDKAVAHLEEGTVVLFAGGTGNPYFTTDSAAALRGLEIGADVVIKATKVDGVYDSDPMVNPEAVRFPELTYAEVLKRNLKVMDAAAISLCMDNGMPILVFDIVTPGNLVKVIAGENIGTLVKE